MLDRTKLNIGQIIPALVYQIKYGCKASHEIKRKKLLPKLEPTAQASKAWDKAISGLYPV
jgi:hypothetical protein